MLPQGLASLFSEKLVLFLSYSTLPVVWSMPCVHCFSHFSVWTLHDINPFEIHLWRMVRLCQDIIKTYSCFHLCCQTLFLTSYFLLQMLWRIWHTQVPPAWAACTDLVLDPVDVSPATCAPSRTIPALLWQWFFPAARLAGVQCQRLLEAVKYQRGRVFIAVMSVSPSTPVLLGYILLLN